MTVSGFAELHDDLRVVARDVLAQGPPSWAVLADAGWLGLEVPEALDGAGATFAETAVVLHELGRAAACTPFLGSVLAVGALLEVAPSDERDALLRAIANGEVVPALALPGESRSFVPDAPLASHVLLVTEEALVALDAGDVAVEPQPVLDATRTFGRVLVDDVAVDGWPLAEGATARLRDRAAVAIACDSVGLADAMLGATVAYAGVRQQFGQPIGSFQAVKHACADMLVRVTLARQLVDAAVLAVAERSPDASVAAAMAKSYACAAAVEVVGTALQLHGGIGYTWESGIHVYLKRAALDRSLYGSPAEHRRRLARRY